MSTTRNETMMITYEQNQHLKSLLAHLLDGNKIRAIKAYRDLFPSVGLEDALVLINRVVVTKELTPDRFVSEAIELLTPPQVMIDWGYPTPQDHRRDVLRSALWTYTYQHPDFVTDAYSESEFGPLADYLDEVLAARYDPTVYHGAWAG